MTRYYDRLCAERRASGERCMFAHGHPTPHKWGLPEDIEEECETCHKGRSQHAEATHPFAWTGRLTMRLTGVTKAAPPLGQLVCDRCRAWWPEGQTRCGYCGHRFAVEQPSSAEAAIYERGGNVAARDYHTHIYCPHGRNRDLPCEACGCGSSAPTPGVQEARLSALRAHPPTWEAASSYGSLSNTSPSPTARPGESYVGWHSRIFDAVVGAYPDARIEPATLPSPAATLGEALGVVRTAAIQHAMSQTWLDGLAALSYAATRRAEADDNACPPCAVCSTSSWIERVGAAWKTCEDCGAPMPRDPSPGVG